MLCKCHQTGKTFGIRVEKTSSGNWKQTWAFPIKENSAQREGYSSSQIIGNFEVPDDEYLGCPYCGSLGWVHCGDCGKLTDSTGTTYFKCGWCGVEGEVCGLYDGSGIQGAGDR